VGGIEWDDQDDHIMVSNTRMRQQAGERWDEMEDMDDDEEDDSDEDVAEGERESQMPQKRQTIVIDVSLLCFSYLEEYQRQ